MQLQLLGIVFFSLSAQELNTKLNMSLQQNTVRVIISCTGAKLSTYLPVDLTSRLALSPKK